MQIPLLDLKAQYVTIKQEIDRAVADVFESQRFVLGPAVAECEKSISAYCGAAYGVGVSSGTDALILALMAEGIGPGDEVITSPYTFFATAGSIWRLGAKPVFVDIDPGTFNLDVSKIEAKITARTKAIVPIHLYGLMADTEVVMEIAQRHGLTVIEDMAQAIGSKRNGRRAGSIGHYGCISFFPSKNLGCAGDGGMAVTNDAARAEKMRILRDHGASPKYYHHMVGGNFRLDELQAAVINVKLRHLDRWTAKRQANAQQYGDLFRDRGIGSGQVILPSEPSKDTSTAGRVRHIYNQFVIRAPGRRDELKAHLFEKGVGTEIYYPVPLHLQKCFAGLGHQAGDFPESERAARETLALPIYPELTAEQAGYVANCIADFFVAPVMTHSVMN